VYTWVDGQYVYKSGTCAGTAGCPSKCPSTYDANVGALLRDIIPDSSTLTLTCAQLGLTAVITNQGLHKHLAIALGVCLALSLIANVYMMFFR
jgi:hypothetical protein